MPNGVINSYVYDAFERLTSKTAHRHSVSYTYVSGSALVASETVSRYDGGATIYSYIYNALGYLTSISKNGTVVAEYEYDATGQLVCEEYPADLKAYVYTYDKAGNITKKQVYSGSIANLTDTITYTYSTSAWGDLLTNYDGTAITYDSIGNPTKWRNSSSLSWDGRTLTSQTLTNGDTLSYTYEHEGRRTQKRVYDSSASSYITYNYVYDGARVISETVTNESDNSSYTLYYVYDENGYVTGLHYNNQPYYFQKNMQGDILRILDKAGTAVVEYSYDAWGNILSVTGTMASTLGQVNPFRYRGYYYDSETGLYYLNSRYYDAEVGRFINADGIIGANGGIVGYNMFAYCNNNPVMLVDPSGLCIHNGYQEVYCQDCKNAIASGSPYKEDRFDHNPQKDQTTWFDDENVTNRDVANKTMNAASAILSALDFFGTAINADWLFIVDAMGTPLDAVFIVADTALFIDESVANGVPTSEIAKDASAMLIMGTATTITTATMMPVVTTAATAYATVHLSTLIGTAACPGFGTAVGIVFGITVSVISGVITDEIINNN